MSQRAGTTIDKATIACWRDINEGDVTKQITQSSARSAKSMISPMVILLALAILGNVLQAATAEEFGSLRLCPAGGRSFVMAWNLACEMKRKKRSLTFHQENALSTVIPPGAKEHETVETKRTVPDGYRPATLTEIMKICCDVGCEVRDLLAYCDPFGPWNS